MLKIKKYGNGSRLMNSCFKYPFQPVLFPRYAFVQAYILIVLPGSRDILQRDQTTSHSQHSNQMLTEPKLQIKHLPCSLPNTIHSPSYYHHNRDVPYITPIYSLYNSYISPIYIDRAYIGVI